MIVDNFWLYELNAMLDALTNSVVLQRFSTTSVCCILCYLITVYARQHGILVVRPTYDFVLMRSIFQNFHAKKSLMSWSVTPYINDPREAGKGKINSSTKPAPFMNLFLHLYVYQWMHTSMTHLLFYSNWKNSQRKQHLTHTQLWLLPNRSLNTFVTNLSFANYKSSNTTSPSSKIAQHVA